MNSWRIASLILLALLGSDAAWSGTVDSIPGLVAWYAADSLQLNDGDPVRSWRDLSAHAHDLIDDQNGAPALFRRDQLNGLPAVLMQKANSHSVTEPFALGPHTIFIVYATEQPQRALFRGRGEATAGLLLRDERSRDVYLNGSAGALRRTQYDKPDADGLRQAEVVTRLGAGDFVEVVTIPLGAAGVVRVPAGAALLSATVE